MTFGVGWGVQVGDVDLVDKKKNGAGAKSCTVVICVHERTCLSIGMENY